MLKANRTHRVAIVTVIVVHFTFTVFEVEFPSIVNVLVIQRNRPIVSVVTNIVNFAVFCVANSREKQELNIGHYL